MSEQDAKETTGTDEQGAGAETETEASVAVVDDTSKDAKSADKETSAGADVAPSDDQADAAADADAEDNDDGEQEDPAVELRLAKREAKKLKTANTKLTKRNEQLEAALSARIEADLKGLDKDDRALVTELAGDDPIQQLKIYTKLTKSNKIGASATRAPADRTRTAGGERVGDKPTTWDEADKRFRKSVRR